MRANRRQALLDAAVAVGAFAASLALLAARGDSGADARELDYIGVILAAGASLPLVAWRREPLAVFVATAASSAVLNGLGYANGPPVGPTIALFLLALSPERTRVPRWAVGAGVGAVFAVHVGTVAAAEQEFPTVPLLFGTVVWGGAWVAGDRLRQRRARTQQARRDADRERSLAAAKERTRIARDLHDSAGHAINVILVQAGAARLLSEKDPERAHAALTTIEEVARETLGEIDVLVSALREDGDKIEPPVGLGAVETLADRHRSAGLDVDIRRLGLQRPLPPGLDQAAYRILQEALTNAARHGDGSARVEIVFGSSSLELRVTNPTRPGSSAHDGHGIVGMRERASLLGGSLAAATSNGAFRVRARLPYGGDSA